MYKTGLPINNISNGPCDLASLITKNGIQKDYILRREAYFGSNIGIGGFDYIIGEIGFFYIFENYSILTDKPELRS
jgi:hypothetical protein